MCDVAMISAMDTQTRRLNAECQLAGTSTGVCGRARHVCKTRSDWETLVTAQVLPVKFVSFVSTQTHQNTDTD